MHLRIIALRYLKIVAATFFIVLVLFAVTVGPSIWTRRVWFGLQAQQLATIKRLGDFPPPGWEQKTWKNALVTPYNVWGNVTFTPEYSKISNDEMRALKDKLEQIVDKTNRDNSIESVDRVFQLLLDQGQRTPFITGYRDALRDEIRTYEDSRSLAP